MTEPRRILVAAGGHGRVVLDALLAAGVRVDAIVDPALSVGAQIMGVSVAGDDAWLDGRDPCDIELYNGAGAAPASMLRNQIHAHWLARGFRFASVVHPSAILARGVEVGAGAQIMAGAIVQTGCHIAENVVINTGASVDHDSTILAGTFVAPRVTLCGQVSIGAEVFIGAGAIVLPGVRIDSKAVIGAGAVVRRDVQGEARVAGNPARPLGNARFRCVQGGDQ
jgi:sugar O-acyltransferase (sialic acid O-acetyltransferase NeuD family)